MTPSNYASIAVAQRESARYYRYARYEFDRGAYVLARLYQDKAAKYAAVCRHMVAVETDSRWVIYNRRDASLVWSNADGWIEGEGFDVFTHCEVLRYNLPIGGAWRRVQINAGGEIISCEAI